MNRTGRNLCIAGVLVLAVISAAGIFAYCRSKINHDLGRSISPSYYKKGKGTPAEYVTGQLGYLNNVVKALNILMPIRRSGIGIIWGSICFMPIFMSDITKPRCSKDPRQEKTMHGGVIKQHRTDNGKVYDP